MASEPSSSRDRVRRHREKLRARGLRPVQFWVLDMDDEAVRAEIRRQCRALRSREQEQEDVDFIDSVADYV